MKYWSRFPVFRVLIPFASGILFCIQHHSPVTVWLILAFISAIVALLFTIRNYATGKYANRWLAGIPVYICFFSLGFVITWLHKTFNYNEHFPENSQTSFYLLEVSKPIDETSGGFRIMTEVKAYKSRSEWTVCRGNLLLYIKDTSHVFSASVGDKIVIRSKLQKLLPPANPGAFDYSKYLETKGISYQCFVNDDACWLIEKSDRFSMLETADRFRKKLLSILEEFLDGNNRLGVAGALLLGYEDWLDPELEEQYSAAGVLHILCVSGMHVGLIYIIFSWMFSWMKGNDFISKLRFPLMIGLIWFYAMVTGLAPSIIRAATMISFMIAGKWLDKNSSIYNTLCSSCVVMFAFDPFLLVSVGFQLSFLAVCGIVVFHQLIFPLWDAPNKLLHHIWELISISVAAQLTTFPLSLYLFHQFPNYFLIGNLLLIPLSTFVMYSGIVLFVSSWVPYLGTLSGFVTGKSIDLLNYLVSFISELPGAVTENISISLEETILLYLLMIAFTLWILIKTRTWLFASMYVLILLLTFRVIALVSSSRVNEFTVYHHKNSSIYSFIQNRNAILFTDSSVSPQQLRFTVEGHLMHALVRQKDTVIVKNFEMLYVGRNQILFINDWPRTFHPESLLSSKQVKVMVLGGDISIQADTILNYFRPEMVVIDASVKSYYLKTLSRTFKKEGIKVHNVKNDGAFKINL